MAAHDLTCNPHIGFVAPRKTLNGRGKSYPEAKLVSVMETGVLFVARFNLNLIFVLSNHTSSTHMVHDS